MYNIKITLIKNMNLLKYCFRTTKEKKINFYNSVLYYKIYYFKDYQQTIKTNYYDNLLNYSL